MSYNYLFKIVVVGDHSCGKSCILLRFAENSFRHDHISTLGVDFKLKTIKLGRDKIRLELWDTAGEYHYSTPNSICCRNLLFIELCFLFQLSFRLQFGI
uniref:Ras family protein n=1 Tax=Parascaris univalens TaxID=6257 RepID=A0A914ZKC5_PARUN